MSGIVTAFDAETGAITWQRPADAIQPSFHTAMSPVVDGARVIVHVGGHNQGALTAFDVSTGAAVWSWDGDGPAYGSPVIAEMEGTRQVIVFTQENFVGVSLADGALLWRRPFTTQATTTSQTPIVYDGDVIQAGRGNGITRFRVVREGTAWTTEDLWHTDDVSLHMANGVVVDGVLYGLSHLNSGQYFGLDLDTGDVLWTSTPRQADHASMLTTGQVVFSLEADGELVILDSSRGRVLAAATLCSRDECQLGTADTLGESRVCPRRDFACAVDRRVARKLPGAHASRLRTGVRWVFPCVLAPSDTLGFGIL